MNYRTTQVLKHILFLSVVFLASLSVLAAAKPSNKWRIKFDGRANTEGRIVFRIVPPQGNPTEVDIAIPKGKTENSVAALVRDQLKAALGEAYHVERDDFEDVLVKVRWKTPDFGLELVNSSVTGLKIKLKRE